MTFRQGCGLFDLDVDDAVLLDQPGTGDDLVGGHVGQDGPEGPVAIGVRAWIVALAQTVGAVPEDPTPPAVNLNLV